MTKLELFNQLLLTGSVLMPTITLLTETFKRIFKIPVRFVPLTAMVTGICFNLMFFELSFIAGAAGALIGLGSIGVWEFGKTTIMGKNSSGAVG